MVAATEAFSFLVGSLVYQLQRIRLRSSPHETGGRLPSRPRSILSAVTPPERGAPVRLLDDDEKRRLTEVRRRSAHEWQEFLEAGPEDALGALAWLAGALGPTPDDPTEMMARIDRARVEDIPWRQIADALGEGDSPEAGRRVMDRRRGWEA